MRDINPLLEPYKYSKHISRDSFDLKELTHFNPNLFKAVLMASPSFSSDMVENMSEEELKTFYDGLMKAEIKTGIRIYHNAYCQAISRVN